MAAPNMATITASLERSFQNCSLNNNQPNSGADESSGSRVLGTGSRSSSTSSSTPHRNHHHHHHHHHDHRHLQNANDTTLELNSHISLPYHWEQCLDLKTGEIYYINWRNGMKAKEDPRSTAANHSSGGDYYYTEEEEESSYDSEESSSESSPNNCRRSEGKYANSNNNYKEEEEEEEEEEGEEKKDGVEEVLVVGGCKSCFMYFMLPKQVHDCPKCCGQLLHFDRSENASL